ncbi:MAG: hypothetical protein EOP06_15250 [Proteobacteria bacterium]|nr:MAG: hypothetical protein EOP06_15250 [Pseudomonadota bacterium]
MVVSTSQRRVLRIKTGLFRFLTLTLSTDKKSSLDERLDTLSIGVCRHLLESGNTLERQVRTLVELVERGTSIALYMWITN